jgi:isopenicillin N synthase-like dioxygenase
MPFELPVVDLEQPDAGRRLDEAAAAIGFFALRGTGIPTEVVEGVRVATTTFFDLATELKAGCRPPRPDYNRGYFGPGEESVEHSLDLRDARPDRFEAFNVGSWTAPAVPVAPRYAGLFAANLWPALGPERLAPLQDAVRAYFSAMSGLTRRLLALLAQRLELPETWFDGPTRCSPDTLRLLRYRRPDPTSTDSATTELGAHSDFGAITVLLADPVPGLQVLTAEGGWVDVIPDPDHFVVNIGDLLAQWTNDRWISSLHRVVPIRPGAPELRQSVPFFQEVHPETVVECLPGCSSVANPPRYAPVTAGEHLLAKLTGPRTGKASRATSTLAGRTVPV